MTIAARGRLNYRAYVHAPAACWWVTSKKIGRWILFKVLLERNTPLAGMNKSSSPIFSYNLSLISPYRLNAIVASFYSYYKLKVVALQVNIFRRNLCPWKYFFRTNGVLLLLTKAFWITFRQLYSDPIHMLFGLVVYTKQWNKRFLFT